MRFDLKKTSPGTWFTFPGQDDVKEEEKKAKICLRLLSAADVRGVGEKTSKKRVEYKIVNPKRGPAVAKRFEYTDSTPQQEQLARELTVDLMIVAWENVEDPAGKPLTCNKQNKVALSDDFPEVVLFIGECLTILAESGPTEVELVKNSKSPQSG